MAGGVVLMLMSKVCLYSLRAAPRAALKAFAVHDTHAIERLNDNWAVATVSRNPFTSAAFDTTPRPPPPKNRVARSLSQRPKLQDRPAASWESSSPKPKQPAQRIESPE